MNEYDFKKIEEKWSKKWAESDYGKATDNSDKPKHYHLIEFPYPSGAGLHVGHCMGYGASDAYCRMKRMQGFEVMFPIGWDAFGLPTENFAIKNKIKPQKATSDNIANFKKQMNSLALSFDWSREVNTTDPKYYKWTQWIFLQFYKHAVIDGKLVEVADDDTKTPRLAYQAEMPVNWCPSCKINLANEEVIAGKCERCGSETEKRKQKQWMLRITKYADRLISDLDNVDYEERIKTQQVNWIGRSTGSTVKFEIRISKFETNHKSEIQNNTKQYIDVFTTRADTLYGATYVVLAPEHPLLANNELGITNYGEVQTYISEAKKKSDIDRADVEKEKTGVELKGVKAINPINNEEIPIFVADYVLAGYGTGAVMAVPAHDSRDFEFAKKYNLPIKKVIKEQDDKDGKENLDDAFTDYGYLVNSDSYDGLESKEAMKKITEKLKENNSGDFAVNYKLRDWIFSRQHYWGEPIPIIYCANCAEINRECQSSNVKCQNSGVGTIIDGTEYALVPVPEDQLPVVLPDVENYEPTDTGESPLAKISDWVNVKCPKCGGNAKRETDTMPNWAGSSWYFLAYAMKINPKSEARNPKQSLNIFKEKQENLKHWMPVDLYNGGMEHTTLHLLYSRFWHKFLFDLAVVPGAEPYQKRIAHGIVLGTDGQKMSKSRGNTISPEEMIAEFGADTLRAYIMFIGPYDQESAWNMNGIQGVHRFIKKVWENIKKCEIRNVEDEMRDEKCEGNKRLELEINKTIKGVSEDIERFSMNTYIAKLMEFNNLLTKEKSIPKNIVEKFLILLSPAMPYVAEELWEQISNADSIFSSEWPEFNQSIIDSDKLEIPIQINGKVRHRVHVSSDISDDELKQMVLAEKIVADHLAGNEPKKVIVVPKKLVSIVV